METEHVTWTMWDKGQKLSWQCRAGEDRGGERGRVGDEERQTGERQTGKDGKNDENFLRGETDKVLCCDRTSCC